MDTLVSYTGPEDTGDGSARLTLDSPHNRNALSSRLVAQLHAGLRDAAADPNVRVVVLGHTGNTFCAGADLSEVSGGDPGGSARLDEGEAKLGPPHEAGGSARLDEGEAKLGPPHEPGDLAADRARELAALLRAIIESPRPVIAAVNGHVRAGGMGLVGACDIAVAGPASTFALTEARIGVAPSIISLTLLPKLSARAAARYYLTGEKFGAAEAAAIGLITLAVEQQADVEATVASLVGDLRLGSPQGLAAAKALTTAAVLAGFDRDAERLSVASARMFVSDEAREGMLAFLQKRPPSWAG